MISNKRDPPLSNNSANFTTSNNRGPPVGNTISVNITTSNNNRAFPVGIISIILTNSRTIRASPFSTGNICNIYKNSTNSGYRATYSNISTNSTNSSTNMGLLALGNTNIHTISSNIRPPATKKEEFSSNIIDSSG